MKVAESVRNQDYRSTGRMQDPAHLLDTVAKALIVLQTSEVDDAVEALVGEGERLGISDNQRPANARFPPGGDGRACKVDSDRVVPTQSGNIDKTTNTAGDVE